MFYQELEVCKKTKYLLITKTRKYFVIMLKKYLVDIRQVSRRRSENRTYCTVRWLKSMVGLRVFDGAYTCSTQLSLGLLSSSVTSMKRSCVLIMFVNIMFSFNLVLTILLLNYPRNYPWEPIEVCTSVRWENT